MLAWSRRTEGQAAVESALTIPMMMFVMLGVLQLTVAYHARILSEYAVFKAARAGSVFRADCERMKSAALMALVPSMSSNLTGTKDLRTLYVESVAAALTNRTRVLTPRVWIDYTLENAKPDRDFDLQLEPGDAKVMRLRVKMAYFFEYRIPFANWIMVNYWLATQLGTSWANSDMTMAVREANQPPGTHSVDGDLVDQVRWATYLGFYSTPIVASWSMRMMSDPLPAARNATGNWKCK